MNIYEGPVFTIGQFAAMHGINKKTLMWYDEIGLLKPAFVRANGYRCYTYKQSGMLETILMLRALLPLAAIEAGRYDDYSALLITLPPARRDDADRVQPAGRYLRAYCQGPWEGLAARYQAMCAYAAEHGLAFAGDAYESGINDAIAGSMAETITQIEIAVVER